MPETETTPHRKKKHAKTSAYISTRHNFRGLDLVKFCSSIGKIAKIILFLKKSLCHGNIGQFVPIFSVYC